MSAPQTLLLTETGVVQSPNGSTSVNVGPIVRALKFLTEGRGDDRGTDEAGNPLPDLMSLAFDVVESIILGGRKADYFRQVKRELEALDDGVGRSSLALAKHATRLQPLAPAAAPEGAAVTLQNLLEQLLAAANTLGKGPTSKPARRRAPPKKKRKTATKPAAAPVKTSRKKPAASKTKRRR